MRFVFLLSAFLTTLGLGTLAFAQAIDSSSVVAPPAPSLEQLLGLLLESAQAGNWVLFGLALAFSALSVFLSVTAVRAALGRRFPWLITPQAGVVLTALAGQLGGMVVSLAAGQQLTVAMVLGAVSSLLASGARSWGRHVALGNGWLVRQEVQVEPGRARGE